MTDRRIGMVLSHKPLVVGFQFVVRNIRLDAENRIRIVWLTNEKAANGAILRVREAKAPRHIC